MKLSIFNIDETRTVVTFIFQRFRQPRQFTLTFKQKIVFQTISERHVEHVNQAFKR